MVISEVVSSPFPPEPSAALSARVGVVAEWLSRVVSEQRPRVGVVHGLEGAGLSQLAALIGAHYSTRQPVEVLQGCYHAPARPGDGVVGAVLGRLGSVPTPDFGALAGALAAALDREGLGDEDEAHALASAALPDGVQAPLSAEERDAILQRLIERLARSAPVILLLDDAHWGHSALGFARRLLERRAEGGSAVLLVLLLERNPAPVEGGAVLELGHVREALRGQGGVWELEMGPPPPAFPRTGVEALLGWMSRNPAVVPALERLAVLGGDCAGDEWSACASELGVGGLDAAHVAGFVQRWNDGWRFAHRSLARAVVEGIAPAALREHHRCCAAGLGGRFGASLGERLATHLLACGDGDRALAVLLSALQLHRRGGDLLLVERLIHRLEDLALQLALHEDDPRRGELLEHRASLARMRGRPDESARFAERAVAFASGLGPAGAELYARGLRALALSLIETDALDRGETQLLHARAVLDGLGLDQAVAEVLGDLAVLADRRGLHTQAEQHARDALHVAERVEDGHLQASVLVRLALALRQQGRLDESLEAYERAEALARQCRNRHALANALRGHANVLRTRGRHEASVAKLRAAMEVMDRVGNQLGYAHCLNGLAESARKRGELKAAERDYRRALELFESLSSGQAIYPRVNLGLVLLGRGLTRQAREQLDEARVTLSAAGRQGMLGAVLVTLLPCLVAERDWDEWEACYHQATHLLAATSQVDTDIAWAAELSGEWSEVAAKLPAELGYAARSFEIALSQLRSLGDEAGEARVRERLQELARLGAPIPLGPFDLLQRIGEGGTGEVWQGVHRLQQVSVAVKVLTQEVARERSVLEAFAQEVRSVAALDHPNVIIVLEHGKVSDTAAVMSGGRLVARSPYLAMEHCAGGTLAGVCGCLPWPDCRRILLALLDALGHAHARGVIHRDIKPANVLLDGPVDAQPSAKLSDFGIAHALRGGPTRSVAVGTPEYMAPEQFTGDWRSYGPWTDLYSLGCVATALVQGAPPFAGESPSALAQAHWMDDPPPLAPLVPVPRGLDGWIRRLLCKRPADRFQRAADAAFALEQLGDEHFVDMRPPPRSGPAPVVSTARTFVLDELDLGATLPAQPSRTDVELPPIRQAAAPVEWRPHRQAADPIALRGAGLALYGLRPVPIIGRDREQDALWATLINVVALSEPRAVLLRGPAGVGKTRLAAWLGERAHALGVANLLRVHGGEGVRWALVGALMELMRCEDLEGHELQAAVDRWLRVEGQWTHERAVGLVDLMEAWRIRQDLDPARVALLGRLLRELATSRPLVVIVEAAQWTFDEFRLGQSMLRQGGVTLLFLYVTRDDQLVESPESLRQIRNWEHEEGFLTLHVAPLAPAEHLRLVRALLDLEETLAAQVAQRTAGNVLYAIELVGDWVRRDLLQLGDGGFHLRPGALTPLPDRLHERWLARVARTVGRLGPRARVALEVLALSASPSCPLNEWMAAFALVDGPLDEALVDALVEEALVWRNGDQVGVAHVILRESLERDASVSGGPRIRRAWAQILEEQEGEVDRARLALLRMRAGEPELALAPLRAAVLGCLNRGRPEQAVELLDLWEEAMRVLGAAEDDPRWGEQLLALAETCAERAYWREAHRHAQRLLLLARRHRWDHLVAPALRMAALGAEASGDWDEAWGNLVDAREIYRFRSDAGGVARCTAGLGSLARTMGRLDEGLEYLNDALEQLHAINDELFAARVRCSLANVALAHEDLDEAERQFQEALRTFKRQGYRVGEAEARNGLGEVHRYRGDLEAAEAAYRWALDLLSAGDSAKALVPRLNLGLIYLARGAFAEASALFEAVRPSVVRRGRHLHGIFLITFRLAAADPSRDDWDQRYQEVQQELRDHRIAEPDVAWPLERAAERARAMGDRRRARALYQLALEQWDRMETDDAVERTKQAIREL